MKPHAILEVDPSIIERNLLISDRPRSTSPEISISQLLGSPAPVKKIDNEDEVPCVHVRPTAGFCVKTHTLEGDKIFLNVCHTSEIPSPKDVSDSELIEILESDDAPTYTVPMSIGALHIEADKGGNICSVYDVAISTDFFNKILTNQLFKTFFMTVVMEGVQNKFGFELTLKSDKPYVILKNRKQIGEIQTHRIQKRGPRQPPKVEPQKKLIEVISSTDEPAASESPGTSERVPVSVSKGAKSAVSVDENNKLRLFVVSPKNGDALLLLALAKIKALTGSDVNLDVSNRRMLISCERNETIDCVLPYSVQPEKAVAEYFVNLQCCDEYSAQMADELMDVISGASHGSYSFIHDNYIYRINKFTHQRVYLSCRVARCKGAGKGTKGSCRSEIYGFELSKPHNHPPEENKIKQFEVKEYVREEARSTKDSSKDIYERAVKLFDCYELSRASVDGLVKRSRERTNVDAVTENTLVRWRPGKEVAANDTENEDVIGRFSIHELDSERNPSAPLRMEEGYDEMGQEEEEEGAAATWEKGLEQEERRGESCDLELEGHGESSGQSIEVVIKAEKLDQQEVPLEFVQVDEGVDQDTFLLDEDGELVVDEEEAVSSESSSDLDMARSPGNSSRESDDDSDFDGPSKHQGGSNAVVNISFKRSPKKRLRHYHSEERHHKRSRPSDVVGDVLAHKKRPTIEESLLQIFTSTYFSSQENVFNLLSQPECIPDDDDEQDWLSSTNTLNIIKSASKLCSFAAVKASHMRKLLVGQTKELDVLEGVLLDHLSSLMCFSGTDFFLKCFGSSIRNAIEQGKRGDRKCKAIWNEEDIYGSSESKNDNIQLAVALLCYSGKAYLALSELIDLPGPHVARKWACNSEGNPGFSAQPFAAIQSEVARRPNTYFACLSVEDVALKRHIDPNGFGYTDLGYGRVENDFVPEATRAVVFYACAVNSHWRFPLGYCLADSLSPQVRSNLICQYVSKLGSAGVKCVGIVLGSSSTTTRVYEEFGAISNDAPAGSFYTIADEKIRVSPFVDTMETMESVKQLLREKRKFFTSSCGEISWSLLELVQEFAKFDDTESWLAPGTYTVDFMNYLRYLKIRIRKDNWPFGRYYPEAMKLLQKYGARSSENWGPTIQFVQTMVDITEIFTTPNDGNSFQAHQKNSFAAINKLIHYLESLRFASGKIVNDRGRRMPVMSLCMNLSSLKVVLRRVSRGVADCWFTLNGVKQFIDEIRSDRELITPVQFRERYFELVSRLDASPSSHFINRYRYRDENPKNFSVESPVSTYKTYVYKPLRSMCDRLLDVFVEKAVSVWLDGVDCPVCFKLMLDSMQGEDLSLRSHLVQLVRRVETELCVMSEIPVDIAGNKFPAFANRVINSLINWDGFKAHDHWFVSSEIGGLCHLTCLVKDLVEIYLRLRLPYLSREIKMAVSDFSECSVKFSLGQFWA